MNRVKENRQWAENFDAQIGPFEARYARLKSSISGLYENAKKKHAEGIQLLVCVCVCVCGVCDVCVMCVMCDVCEVCDFCVGMCA